jgi:hypothetical protein
VLRTCPRGLWAFLLGAILLAGAVSAADPNPVSPSRLDALSARYLGKPYKLDCLGEGKGPDRDPLYDPKRVDCQTLVEQVMAEAVAEGVGGREAAVRLIRYHRGEVALENRYHYCLPDWVENPWPVRDITAVVGGAAVKVDKRRIDLPAFLKGRGGSPKRSPQPAREVSFRYIPRNAVVKRLAQVPDGSIGIFVHRRPDLISAHLGFVFRRKSGPVLRHASQTRGKVIDEPLTSYLQRAPKAFVGMVFLQPDLTRLTSR